MYQVKVIGIGGAGCNIVKKMLEARINYAEYYVVNTDKQLLAMSPCENKIQLGHSITKGNGTADYETGKACAETDIELLKKAIVGAKLLFIIAGMGGGNGSGVAPLIAKIAKELGIVTLAVVTTPFGFEGKNRIENTTKGLKALKEYVDSIVILSNDKVKTVVPPHTLMRDALRIADDTLIQVLKSILGIIYWPALINIDLGCVQDILKKGGETHIGTSIAFGENRVIEAVRLAVNNPLSETTIEGARSIILNIVVGDDLAFYEVEDAAEIVSSVVSNAADIRLSLRIDPEIKDGIEITVIANNFKKQDKIY